MNPYIYSVANDTLNGAISDSLNQNIHDSDITYSLTSITTIGDIITIIFSDDLSAGDETILDGLIAAHDGVALLEISYTSIGVLPAFASKSLPDGTKLFKRVHGASSTTILAGQTGSIELVIPYATCKFSGAEIINTSMGDTLDFLILDTATNTYSGLDVGTYGANFQLNQFGFDVVLPNGSYSNTSNYDADLFQDMKLKCVYTNNSTSDKIVHMNVELHEVKA